MGEHRKPRSTAHMQAQCDAFNAKHAVGDTIRVWSGHIEGEPKPVQIRYRAQILGGHTPVVYVTGGQGCIDLSHVAPSLPPDPTPAGKTGSAS